MLSDHVDSLNELKNYLIYNNFVLNGSGVNVYENPKYYFFKKPILVMFQEDNNIIIKNLSDNRKYDFKKDTSDFLLIEFIKYLENEFNFVV